MPTALVGIVAPHVIPCHTQIVMRLLLNPLRINVRIGSRIGRF